MSWLIDLTGQRFGRLVVLSHGGASKSGKVMWLCRCDCGAERAIVGDSLRSGRTQSCGCLQREGATRHGMIKHPAYTSWVCMIQRCTSPRGTNWMNYGGRGITVCDRWRESFESFWEDMGPTWVQGLSLDRIDVDGNYELRNVQWATDKQQRRNKRNSRLIETPWGAISIADAVERSGISRDTIKWRIKKGHPADQLFDPVKPRKKAA